MDIYAGYDFNEIFKNNWYKVSDEFAVVSISKNACSTVNVQSWCYQKNLDITNYKDAEYKHLTETNFGHIFHNNRTDYILHKKPKGIKYVCIIRDPLERFISAYKTKTFINDNNLSFNDFLLNVKQTFNECKTNINQHIQTQNKHFDFEDVDIFVYACDYERFCKENNINFIKLNQNEDKSYQDKIILTEEHISIVKELYKEDYDMIEKIKHTGKLYGTL